MPKIPIEALKDLGTKGVEAYKKNPQMVKAALAMAPALLKGLAELNNNRYEWHRNKLKKKTELGKIEYE